MVEYVWLIGFWLGPLVVWGLLAWHADNKLQVGAYCPEHANTLSCLRLIRLFGGLGSAHKLPGAYWHTTKTIGFKLGPIGLNS